MTDSEDNGMTPLHLAAYYCNLEAVKEILASGAYPDVRDRGGFTPLHWCGLCGIVGTRQHSIAKALLRAGADPNACTDNGDSVLCWAIESGNTLIIKILIDWGADVKLVANEVTPLMTAARVGNRKIVEMLLRAGADPSVKVGSFQAYHYADYYGHDGLARMLKRGI